MIPPMTEFEGLIPFVFLAFGAVDRLAMGDTLLLTDIRAPLRMFMKTMHQQSGISSHTGHGVRMRLCPATSFTHPLNMEKFHRPLRKHTP